MIDTALNCAANEALKRAAKKSSAKKTTISVSLPSNDKKRTCKWYFIDAKD